MRYAFLVAWREYAENAKTKGFWIGLFLLPTILFFSIQVPIWLEQKAAPVRYFILVDQSGKLAPALESALDKSYQRQMLASLKEYARKNLASPTGSAQPAPSVLDDLNENNTESLDAFNSQGGKDFFLAQLRPRLRADAPEFREPRRRFQQVPLPAHLKAGADLALLAEDLKPYLRHERNLASGALPVELAAAILIPGDLDRHIIHPQVQPPTTNRQERLGTAPPAEGRSPAPRDPGSHDSVGSQSAAPGDPSASGHQSPLSSHAIQYWSANASDPVLREEVERAINAEIRRREYLARGLDGAAVQQVERTYAPFAYLNPKKEKGQEAMGATDVIRQWAPSGFVYLLWVAIFSIMQMLLSNMIEEKSNRIIEVLLSSVTPGELMMGKLVGIAAIGLTMIGAWMAALFGILSWKSGGASEFAGQVFVVLRTSNLVPVFAVYFLLGYLMYAAFILSIGSVCNTLKEAQSYMAVMTMIMMVPLMTMTFIPKDPNGAVARILSWIPLYTPFTMMNRATADPPLVDLVGTLLLLLVTTGAALYLAGKIFRIGILRTGQPPKLVELLKWALRR